MWQWNKIQCIYFFANYLLQPIKAQNLSSFSFLYYENNSVAVSCTATPPTESSELPWFFSWRYDGITELLQDLLQQEQIATAGVLKGLYTFYTPGPLHPYSERTSVSVYPRNVADVYDHKYTSYLHVQSLTLADAGRVIRAYVDEDLGVSSSLVLSECVDGQYTMTSQSATPCLTGCRAELSLHCPSGFTKSQSGICQVDGTFVPHPSCDSTITRFSTIETIPPSPDNVLVSGFPNLIITAKFEKRDLLICVWIYGGELDWSQFYVAGFGGCFPRIGKTANISCNEKIENGIRYVFSNLTLLQPLTYLDLVELDVVVRCDNGFLIPLPKKLVLDCPARTPNGVNIVSPSNYHGAVGTFECSPDEELTYSNGTLLSVFDTTCLFSAKWSHQENLQCWKAPVVKIRDGLTVKEGNDLDIFCDYEEVIPYGEYSLFVVGQLGVIRPKKLPLTLVSMRPTHNNMIIHCQALTPYTDKYNDTGHSPWRTLNVIYAPYSDVPIKCTWFVNEPHWCNISVYSNPTAEYVEVVQVGSQAHRFSPRGPDSISMVDELETFHFFVYNVLISYAGFYNLVLRSPQLHGTHAIPFEVVVVDRVYPDGVWLSGQSSAFIILLFISVVLFVATIILLVPKLHDKYVSSKDVGKEVEAQEVDEMETFSVYHSDTEVVPSTPRRATHSRSVSFALVEDKTPLESYSKDDINIHYGYGTDEDSNYSQATSKHKKIFAGPSAY